MSTTPSVGPRSLDVTPPPDTLVEMARGRDGAPYTWLGAVAGLAYLLAVVVARLRG